MLSADQTGWRGCGRDLKDIDESFGTKIFSRGRKLMGVSVLTKYYRLRYSGAPIRCCQEAELKEKVIFVAYTRVIHTITQ